MNLYLREVWLVFYNATFRPNRLALGESKVDSREKSARRISWADAIWLPTEPARRLLWLYCLPWWLLGIVVLVSFGWHRFELVSLVFLSLMLVLSGWATTTIWPNLGLLWPLLA